MQELSLSLMASSSDPLAEIGPVLAEFEAEQHVRVDVQLMSWDTAWGELVKMALYRHGPDVSEVGLTWAVNLQMMDALRPFSAAEVAAFGGSASVVPAVWHSEVSADAQLRWSIPWNVYTHVLCYRRDLLAQAGIDAAQAFDTAAHLAETLARLQQNGCEVPLALVTSSEYIRDNLHLMANWVWGHGGHFASDDGKRILLDSVEARRGMQAYFSLYRHLPPAARNLGMVETYDLFRQGRAASLMLPVTHLYRYFRSDVAQLAPEVAAQLGTTALSSVPYVGGSNLVLWKHVPPARMTAALKLMRFLTGRRAELLYGQRAGIPPARLDALADPFFVGEPFQGVSTALQTGRAYRSLERWGIIEERLIATLSKIRADVLAQPEADLDSLIGRQLDPVIKALNLILRD